MGLLDDEGLGAAFGMFPQMKPKRRLQDREASANVPLDVLRGRLAGLLGLIPDTANFMGRSPMPTETFGETQYDPAQQLPYGSEYYLENLPLRPTSKVGEVSGRAGSFVPINPMPAVRAAAAGAKALGPTAAAMGENYMGRMGMMPQLDVYHGTPHTLPPTPRNPLGEFDASKIGTGEGAQAYGHGIYTAEAPDVATEYARNLANRDVANQGRLNAHANAQRLAAVAKDPAYAADDIKFVLSNEPDHPQKQLLSETLRQLESGDYKKPLANKGNLYKIDLPDKMIAKMLDYDKHLSEQSPEVQKILMPYQKEIGGSFGTGEQTLKAIAFERRMKGLDDSPAAVSQQLRDMGIPGIKYLDATSRGVGKGTRNFVTFPGEEKKMTILERNGQGFTGGLLMPRVVEKGGWPIDVPGRSGITATSKQEVKGLADSFADSVREMGFDATVEHSGSKAGASSYVRINDPQTGRFINKPIRISDHSKGTRELQGVIEILNPASDFEKVFSMLQDMRSQGPAASMVQNQLAEKLIAEGVKPKTAYQRASQGLTDEEKKRQLAGLLYP